MTPPLFVLDPRPPVTEQRPILAERLGSLDGVTVALIHNGKTHGRELMEYILEELGTRWDLGAVIHLGPPSPGYGGNPDDAAPAAETAMAAISAIGD